MCCEQELYLEWMKESKSGFELECSRCDLQPFYHNRRFWVHFVTWRLLFPFVHMRGESQIAAVIEARQPSTYIFYRGARKLKTFYLRSVSTFNFYISKRWPWRLIKLDATVQPTNDENDGIVLAEVMDEFSYGFRPRGKARSSETRPTQNELKNIFIRTTLTANLKKVTNGWDDSRQRCSHFPDRTLTTS